MSLIGDKLPNIQTQFSQWYNEIVFKADLVDKVPVKGCIVIKPYGYKVWEEIQKILDKQIKEMGALNAAFPLLIPHSFIAAEKDHLDGFSPEIAVVNFAGGKKLEEPYIIRPTSETVIHYMFGRWIKSWRDLPIRVNQWCSVVRWEKKPKPFIRTTEFWWQEGHTAHEESAQAYDQAHEARRSYQKFISGVLNIPVICGSKPDIEKFAGARATYTLEGIMQDGKAVQMGTSHVLQQSFAEEFSIKFQNKEGQMAYPVLTSWGVSTRLIGALIMAHGDQKGIVFPFHVAPIQFVVIPIARSDEQRQAIEGVVKKISAFLADAGYRAFVDISEKTPGNKFNEWEMKGVPIRIEIGPKDIESKQLVLLQRNNLGKKQSILLEDFFGSDFIPSLIKEYSKRLFDIAYEKCMSKIGMITLLEESNMPILTKKIEIEVDNDEAEEIEENGENKAFVCYWCDDSSSYWKFKERGLTVRCLLDDDMLSAFSSKDPVCVVHGKECTGNLHRVLIAKSY